MGNICWLASYPKSGNTWVRAFIENYLRNPAQPVDINTLHRASQAEASAFRYLPYARGRDITTLSEEDVCAMRPMVHSDMAREAQGTVFVKTHNFLGSYRGHPLHTPAVTSGAIYIVRNPLDVAVSLANYFALSLDEAIRYMAEEMTGTPMEAENVSQIITSWSNHVQSWTGGDDPKILVLRYEDLLTRPLKAFGRVVSFIGLPRDRARLDKALRFSSFREMQRQERKRGFVERHEDARAFFRKGSLNQWREALSEDQLRRLVEDHREQMLRFRYLPPAYR
jgi:hypothetical protein